MQHTELHTGRQQQQQQQQQQKLQQQLGTQSAHVRIPVEIIEDDHVCSNDVEAEAARSCAHEKHWDGRILSEEVN
jgi:hypothetical protein